MRTLVNFRKPTVPCLLSSVSKLDFQIPPSFFSLSIERRQWGAADGLPDAPWLIICPASLVGNWTREFNRFFKKGAIRLFQYGGTYASHSNFWTEQSEWWAKPVGLGEYQKVVICSTSVRHSLPPFRFPKFPDSNRHSLPMPPRFWSFTKPKSRPLKQGRSKRPRARVSLTFSGLEWLLMKPTSFVLAMSSSRL